MNSNGSNGVTVTRYTPFEDLPQFLSVNEFAVFVGIGRGTAYEMVRAGKITYRKFGRVIRIPRSECQALEHVRS